MQHMLQKVVIPTSWINALGAFHGGWERDTSTCHCCQFQGIKREIDGFLDGDVVGSATVGDTEPRGKRHGLDRVWVVWSGPGARRLPDLHSAGRSKC